MLSERLVRNWWVLLIRGVLAIVFGILAYLQPEATLSALILLFGAYSLTDGFLSALTAISGRQGRHEDDHGWLSFLEGVVGIAVGALTLFAPGVTTIALLFYIGVRAIAVGIVEIVTAVRLRKEVAGEWLLLLAGLLSASFGVVLLTRPSAGALAVLWLVATFAVLFGTILILLAFTARGFGTRLKAAQVRSV